MEREKNVRDLSLWINAPTLEDSAIPFHISPRKGALGALLDGSKDLSGDPRVGLHVVMNRCLQHGRLLHERKLI